MQKKMQKARSKRNRAVKSGTGKVFARQAARLRVLKKLILEQQWKMN